LFELGLGCAAQVNLHWSNSSAGTEMKHKRKDRKGNISVEDCRGKPEVGK
jgi:hypothetical protein